MKRSFSKSLIIVLTLLVLTFSILGVSPASALLTVTDGIAASLVLGQADFTSNTPATSQTGMNSPQQIAVDPTTGKVFVADPGNHRVLRFASVAALTNDAAAEAVLGQTNFTSNTPATTQSGMSSPLGVYVDSAGRLWVGDTNNHRVLRFDNASTKANGANADGVLGQINFTSGSSATAQNRMATPFSVFVDSGGRLWVSEYGNSRVLRFDNAAASPNGDNADGVLGQSIFTTNTCVNAPPTATGMCLPTRIHVDSGGRPTT